MIAEGKYVLVALGDELYGIHVLEVETILNDQKPVRMPRTPKMLLGVFELRGKTLAAMDLRLRLELPEREGDARHVVVQTPVGPVSLRVDQVVGITTFEQSAFSEPNSLLSQGNDQFLAGVAQQDDRLVAILDMNHIVPECLKKKIAKTEAKVAA